VNTIGTQLTGIHGDFESSLNRLRILLGELQDKVMRVRMTPMTTIANRLRRTVRETARQLDKEILFTIQGEDIELDKMVWEKLADPLMHLLRNAVDHGIETTAQRKELGKPIPAKIHLSAQYQGDHVVIRVMDDGSGIDLKAIRHVTASCALVPDAATMTDEELVDMIFRPGFSTCMDISEVSGRGVGMDVVKGNIHALKGRIHIEASEKDIGTTFQIRIPLTLAVLRALMFSIGGRIYATPLYEIKEILRIDPKSIRKGNDNSKTIQWDNRPIPFYQLSDHVPVDDADTQRSDNKEQPLVLVIDTGSWQGAVAIDQMHGQKDIVVKHLGAHLNRVTGIAGAAVLGDGRIVPILNLEELLMAGQAQEHRPIKQPSRPIRKSLNILVVDDSVSVRTVVSRLMQRQGWEVQSAKDGVEALECLHTYRPDLIVLDIEMPRMNGYEFMAAFRAQEAFSDIPVIMLTSRAAQKYREKAKAVGVNGFLIKPYEDQNFIALIHRLTAPRKKVIPFDPKRLRKPSDA
jgi:chemosensory pili system protein ChpA (sensor histidine kinase/response regulator)